MELDGKIAIITGAASGIGKATAILFAQEGAKVVASDINRSGGEATVTAIKTNGGEALFFAADVSKEEDVQKLIDTASSQFGTVDILVNNAGIMDNFEPAGEINDVAWEKIFAINTTSIMRMTRKILPLFLEKGAGNIINIASIGGLHGGIAGAIYTASKHAVVGFTKNVAFMYAGTGIRCNAIAPGGVATNIGLTITAPSKKGIERTGLGMALNPRLGQPEEIAAVAVFLASDKASFVNGHVLVADAGWTSYM
jgi:NAD(P)-dependent dehydrogenase (short-subunit alcohol dehydrogenase family)